MIVWLDFLLEKVGDLQIKVWIWILATKSIRFFEKIQIGYKEN